MGVSGFGAAWRRWPHLMALVVIVLLGWAQSAAAQTERTFSSDAGIIFNTIKPDKSVDFEMVMGKLKEALQASDDPIRQDMAAGWKIFKSVEPGPSGNVLYVWVMDPVVTGGDYTVSKILAEAFPEDVQDLYQRYSDAYASGQNLVNLQLIQDLGLAMAPSGLEEIRLADQP